MQKQEQNQEKRDGELLQQPKNQAQLMTNPSPSPPSSSSSPSHEFSFTISLHPSSASAKTKSTTTSPPFAAAIDLSPADEIFFHGHLLPLHLLSHLPVSPRSSTNSLDSFTLPIQELSQNDHHHHHNSNGSDDQYINIDHHHPINSQESSLLERKAGQKSKSFSLFGLPRWRKAREKEYDHYQDEAQKRNKSKFELSHVLKRYMRLIKPFISLRSSRRENSDNNSAQRKPAFSYSGNLKVRSKKEYFMRGRREFSAPASMSTSPTNSGLLVASGSLTPKSTSDSTMEELQAAIQAAIAHCKKSIATEDKNQAAVTT